AVPVAALVNPGSSKITHEPASSWLTLMGSSVRSVVTLISVPATTESSPLAVNSLPLRLSTTGGWAGAPAPPARGPGPPGPAAPGPPRAGAAPGPGAPARAGAAAPAAAPAAPGPP